MKERAHVRLVGGSESWRAWIRNKLSLLADGISFEVFSTIDEVSKDRDASSHYTLFIYVSSLSAKYINELRDLRQRVPTDFLVLGVPDGDFELPVELVSSIDEYLPDGDVLRLSFIAKKALDRWSISSNTIQGDIVMERISNLTKTGSWSWNVTANEIVWSAQLYEIFERDIALGPPDLEKVLKIYHGEDAPLLQQSVERAAREGLEYDLELSLVTEKGTNKSVRAVGVPVKDHEGNVVELHGIVSDVTLQTEMLRELRENEMRLDLAVHGAELGIWDVNFLTGEHFTNGRWWEMLGYSPDEANNTLEFFESLLHPEDRLLPREEVRRIEDGGTNEFNLTLRLMGKDGQYRTILDRGRVVQFDGDGRALRMVGTHSDLTEQYRVQTELQKTKQFMDLAVVGGELGLWELDLVTDATYFNEMWHDMLGYGREEISFSLEFFQSLLHPEDAEIPNAQMQRVFDGMDDVYEAVFRMRAKNGTYRHILAHGQFVAWDSKGQPTKLAGSHLDITAQVKAEHSYQEANRKLRALIDAAPIAVYLLDKQGAVVDLWNPAAERIFGFRREEAVGKEMPIPLGVGNDDSVHFFDYIRAGGSLVQERLKCENRQGRELVLEITTGTQFDELGHFESVLVVASDVTDLVRKEQRLEEALQDKVVLMQETHHRIKNNLAMVSSIIDMQRMQSGNSRYLDSATSRIKSIAMVHELLYKSGDFRNVDISSYYKKLVRNILESLTEVDGRSRFLLDIELSRIATNQAIPLGLLLNELITNSIKYAYSEEGELFALSLRASAEATVEFSYQDFGPGFKGDQPNETEGFGMQLIKSLLGQLRAEYQLSTTNGFRLDFRCPISTEPIGDGASS